MKDNPLLQPFNEAPFEQIKTDHFKPAIEQAIKAAKAEIETITSSTEATTFQNVIEALEFSGEQLDRITSIFFNLNSAETNEDIQRIAQEVSPWLTDFKNDLLLNETLFKKVDAVFQQQKELDLTSEQQMLLDKKYKAFVRNGANLSHEDKDALREIDKQLSKLSLTFGEHVLAETNRYELHITDEAKLSGLPEGTKEAAAQLAKSKDKEGWIFTLDYPSYVPFMKYADNRELRKELSIAFGAKGFHGDELDNQEIVLEITSLRHQRANLLGFDTHADFVLAERMAKSPQGVQNFLLDLLQKAKPAAIREFNELTDFAKELDQLPFLEKWDGAYYAEKLKKKRFNLDDEALKPYFRLENVINGVFTVAQKLFGLTFKQVDNIEVYHKEVKTYHVLDAEGEFVSLFYADFHPRPGKRGGAWMTSYKPQSIRDGNNDRPHVSIVCNFTKPTASKPSLLTFNEVTTLFHEFGHALHGMLANTTYPSLSGTSVYWDFVELPSQMLENWCYEPEALALFATHYETGEVIPTEYVEKIKASCNFHEGMQTLRQLSFGMLDMAWHGEDPGEVTNVKEHENSAFEQTKLYPDVNENCMSTSFAHIFQGGYSAGYYSYKWAEVLDADAFAYFQEEGIFNTEVSRKFKDFVLSQGGTVDPMELYVRFRGRKPDPNALLKRAGLLPG
ncbi:M3 family metallopeptidase [Gangjinia marincola]|uniref:M3 family metallopeptidase n=1 Tax=Gangjinia marincola TaxID=578463 RepID=A0ABN1MK26_9FLAO